MSAMNDVVLKNMTFNGQKVKKWFHNDARVFSAGNIVTYYVDSGVTRSVEMDSDVDILSDESIYIPEKDGWTFVGWRDDETASGDVLSSKIMGDEPIALYAVYCRIITLSYKVNGTTYTETGTRYYNNGNTANATFTVSDPTLSGATFKGWSTSDSSSSIAYSSISDLDLSVGVTVYSVFTYDTVTKSVNSGNGTVQTYTIYIDNTKYSKITLTSSAENNMCSARIYTPSGEEICICHTSVGLTQSTTSFVTGTYTVETRSNYAYANTTSTLTLAGKTVVG